MLDLKRLTQAFIVQRVETPIHREHPLAKMLGTLLLFIVLLSSNILCITLVVIIVIIELGIGRTLRNILSFLWSIRYFLIIIGVLSYLLYIPYRATIILIRAIIGGILLMNFIITTDYMSLAQALEKIKMPEYQFLLANGTLHPDHVFYYTPEEIVYMSGYAKRTGVRDAPTIIFERAVHEEEVPQLDPVEYAIFIQEKASKIVTMLVTSAVRKKYIEILDSSEKGFTVRVLRNRCAICKKPLPKFNFYMCLTCESTGHLQHLVDENGFCRICGDKAKVIEIKPKYYEKLLVELAEDGFLSVEDLQQVLDVIAKRVQNMVWRADWNKIRKKHEQYIRRQWYRVYHSPYPYYYYYRGYYYRNGGMDWLWMWLWLDKEYQKLFDGIRNLIPQPGNFKLPEPPSWLPDEFKKLPEFAHHQITEAMEKFVIPKSIEELAKSLKLNVEEMVSRLENATDLISKQLTNNFENFSKKITELISSCVTHDDCHSACHSACVWSACHSACHSAGGWG